MIIMPSNMPINDNSENIITELKTAVITLEKVSKVISMAIIPRTRNVLPTQRMRFLRFDFIRLSLEVPLFPFLLLIAVLWTLFLVFLAGTPRIVRKIIPAIITMGMICSNPIRTGPSFSVLYQHSIHIFFFPYPMNVLAESNPY